MKFDRIRAMQVFVRGVELRGFTAAARDLGMTQPAVTKSFRTLEDHLGAQLLNRSTRTVVPSDEGQVFYDDARRPLEALMEAEARIGKRAEVPSGPLRIACAIAFGRIILVPIIKRFVEENPRVRVELLITDRMIDMVKEGIDVSVRIGELADLTLRARRVGSAPRMTLASPDHIARRGAPEALTDLSAHDCLIFTGLASRERWIYDTSRDGSASMSRDASRATPPRVRAPRSCRASASATIRSGFSVPSSPKERSSRSSRGSRRPHLRSTQSFSPAATSPPRR